MMRIMLMTLGLLAVIGGAPAGSGFLMQAGWAAEEGASVVPAAGPDQRLEEPRTLDTFYAFPRYESLHDWLTRKQQLRDHLLVSMGCYPMPEKTPLQVQRFDRTEYDGYAIEKVYFESLPGFYVTGNLFLPLGDGPHPGMLSVHGHWGDGRLTHEENNSIPTRCITLAREGFVVFSFDMIGYVDSVQMTHRWGEPADWLWGYSAHGLQFWNSVRALDFITSLPEVDAERIGMTGASGGGTQTYCLMATDERIDAAAPVNMISSHFQGGCVCENAPNLRMDAFNTEYAAMMAPRDLLMISATGDWTRETLRVEFPAIRSIYALFDEAENLSTVQIDAPHNYNQQSRLPMYEFFYETLQTGLTDQQASEPEIDLPPFEAMRVFPNGKEDLPEGALSAEEIRAQWIAASETQLQQIFPQDELRLSTLKIRGRTALKHTLGADKPAWNQLDIQRMARFERDDVIIEQYRLSRARVGEHIAAVLLLPPEADRSKAGVVLIDPMGVAAAFEDDGDTPNDMVKGLLSDGHPVLACAPFGTAGSAGIPSQRKRDVEHFYTYNPSDTALQVQDILTCIAFLEGRRDVNGAALLGQGETGPAALLAAALAPSLEAAAIDANGFAIDDDATYLESLFVPGLRRAGDLRVAQALIAPKPLLIYDTRDDESADGFSADWAEAAYSTLQAGDELNHLRDNALPMERAEWLASQLP